MKQALTFFILIICSSVLVQAQTKKIAHKSHSGNATSFKTALNLDLFDISSSNFGMAPAKIVTYAKLDSVVFLSKDKAIMVTSEFCHDRYEKTTTVWKAGKDTVTDHPLFSKQHSLDSIKSVLKMQYYFRNPVDSIKFIGFDNSKEIQSAPPSSSQRRSDEQTLLPVSGSDSNKPPFDNHLPMSIGILALFSLFAGLFSWNYRQS